MMPGGRTVLVLRALGLGDLCAAVPALRALRRALPDDRLVLAAPAWQAPLARLAGVDEVVDTAELQPIPTSAHGAELAVNLHGRGPQSTELLAATEPRRLIAFARRPTPRSGGHRTPMDVPSVPQNGDASVEWRAGEHEVHRWCRLLTESGIPADPADIHLPRPARRHVPPGLSSAEATGPNRYRIGPVGFSVLHPGAASAGRRWPADRFAAVLRHLLDGGRRVVLTGSAAERSLCNEIVAAADLGPDADVAVLAGETDVMQLAATVAEADLLVANDTGVAHLATAFATPSVVLFGPTPPDEWGPPPTGPHRALWAGRRGDPHATALDPGLAEITVAEVLDAVEEVTADRVPA